MKANSAILGLLIVAVWVSCGSACHRDSVAPPNDCGSPLLRAIFAGDESQIQRIIDSRKGLNFKGCKEEKTPLVTAIGHSMPQVAKALVVSGADPDTATRDGTTPLLAASFACYEEVVAVLLQHGASVNDVNRFGGSALMSASGWNPMCLEGKVVSLLLKAGAKLELRDAYGQTALTVASFSGNESAVRQLVAAGANLDPVSD